MNPDDIARILDDLGERLGPAGSYVFALAVKQALIEGVTNVIAAGVLGAITVFLWRGVRGYRSQAWAKWNARTNKSYPSIDGHPNEDMTVGFPSIGFYIAVAIAIVGAMSALTGAITKLLNPEYAALADILSRIVR